MVSAHEKLGKDFSMSVTFGAASSEVIGFDLRCMEGHSYLDEGQAPMDFETALGVLEIVKNGNGLADCDDDCAYYGFHTEPITVGPEIDYLNVSNRNAVSILQVLGLMSDEDRFEDVCYGSISGEDLLGRILMAEAIAPVSAETPEIVETGENGATLIDCGRIEGYVQEKLAVLKNIAEFAIDNNREIHWS